MPEDAKEAIGHGIRAKRSKSGAVSFDLLSTEGGHGGNIDPLSIALKLWQHTREDGELTQMRESMTQLQAANMPDMVIDV